MADYSSIVDPQYTATGEPSLVMRRNPANTGNCAIYQESLDLRIFEDGKVDLNLRTSYGSGDGVPSDEWHGRTLTYTIPGTFIDADRLREDLREGGKLAVLIDRVIAGHSVEWDGSNHVGRLTEDATEAGEALQAALGDGFTDPAYEMSGWALWDAGDWLDSTPFDELGVTVDATEADISAAVDHWESVARTDCVVLMGLPEAIEARIQQERERAAEEAENVD